MFSKFNKVMLLGALCLISIVANASTVSYSITSDNWPTQMVLAQPQSVTFTLTNNTPLAAIIGLELKGPFTWQRAMQNAGTCPDTIFTTGYSLSAGASCTLMGIVTPQKIGAQTLMGNIWIHANHELSANYTFDTHVLSSVPPTPTPDPTPTPIQVQLEMPNGQAVSSISLTQPQTVSYQFNNLGAQPVNLGNFVLSSKLNNVIGNFSACAAAPLNPGATCTISFTVSQNAYGTDSAGFTWQAQQGTQTLNGQTSVTVGGTTVTINQGQDIVVSQLAPGSFTITNTGNFYWQAPVADAPITYVQSNPTWVNFTLDPSCQFPLAPGANCKINYTLNSLNTQPVQVIAQGINLSMVQQNFVSSVPLAITADLDNQHLMYRAIKITNWASNARTITVLQNAVPQSLVKEVELCTSQGNCTASYTRVKACADRNIAMTLAAGDYCMIWYHTLPPTPGGVVEHGDTLTITAQAANQMAPDTANFTLNYGADLYVGGAWKLSLLRWDGKNWYTVGGGLNNSVRALASDDSDLYVGGDFTQTNTGAMTLNHIAQWNGTAWNALQHGVDNSVYAIVSAGNTLYIGGNFVNTGDKLTLLNAIAQWNNNTWSSLNKGLKSTITGRPVLISRLGFDPQSGKLYVGGTFNQTVQGVTLSPNIAQWNGQSWDSLGTGSPNAFYTLAVQNGTLYASGNFQGSSLAQWNGQSWVGISGAPVLNMTGIWALVFANNNLVVAGDYTTANLNYVASWTGKTWTALEAGLKLQSYSVIFTLALSGTNVYAGGVFTETSTPARFNNIARWDGKLWQPLGTGVPGGVIMALQADIPHLRIAPVGTTYQASHPSR